jgi:hypothetical protein
LHTPCLLAVLARADTVRVDASAKTGRVQGRGVMEVKPKPDVTLALMHTVADSTVDFRRLSP